MRALTISPGKANTLELSQIEEPDLADGDVLVETLAVGLCGTDHELVKGNYGQAPPDTDRLVIGHENLGRVIEATTDSPVKVGDLVVGIVRRPDPVPCPACAIGEWDMCRNNLYVEHGIRGLDGFAREQWRANADDMVVIPANLADVGVLLEPTTVVAKAWEQIEKITARAYFPEKPMVAVIGAGPIGLLATMLGRQRGHDVHLFDLPTEGIKPELAAALGALYHPESLTKSCLRPDIIIECTGVPAAIVEAMSQAGMDGIVCLTGVSSHRNMAVDVGGFNREAVLQNSVVFGTVNANRRHYEAAVEALHKADNDFLRRMITRRVPVEDYVKGFEHHDDDVKVVIDFAK